MIEEKTETGQEVADVADYWEATLSQAAAQDPSVSASGKKRPTRSGAPAPVSVDVGPKVRTSDVAPLVKAVGGVTTRLAEVSALTDEEVEGIAEPAAALLEIVAPETPPWMIPALTLSARIGDAAAARRAEFVAKHPKSADDAPLREEDDEPTTTLAEADDF